MTKPECHEHGSNGRSGHVHRKRGVRGVGNSKQGCEFHDDEWCYVGLSKRDQDGRLAKVESEGDRDRDPKLWSSVVGVGEEVG